jgi:hypothetical protein
VHGAFGVVSALLVVFSVCWALVAADAPAIAPKKSSKSATATNIHRRSPLPNVVVLAADGWADSDLVTNGTSPNLEKLAAEGLRWTQAYAGAASIPASRAALMTGLRCFGSRDTGRLRSVSGTWAATTLPDIR